MKNYTKIILILAVAIINAVAIVIAAYILGSFIKEGLFELGVELENGLRNMPLN